MMAKAFVFMRKKMVVYASDETIEKLAKDYDAAMKEATEAHSNAMKGENNPMYGKHHSERTKKKLSEAAKGRPGSNKGKKFSEEHKKKIGDSKKGNNYFLGKHHSVESKKKMSDATKVQMKGMRFFNNGEINIRAKECPPGFIPGRIK